VHVRDGPCHVELAETGPQRANRVQCEICRVYTNDFSFDRTEEGLKLIRQYRGNSINILRKSNMNVLCRDGAS
jgi:hypothetical protein